MIDILHIEQLQVATHIGVHAWEQHILQNLFIDISIPVDTRECDDKLENTLDYDAICRTVTAFVQTNHFQLIETVANKVALLIQEEFSVDSITVSVSKPHAIKNARDIRITVQRERNSIEENK